MVKWTRVPILLAIAIPCWSADAPGRLLTEAQALRLLRDSPHHRELRAEVTVAEARNLRYRFYPNPGVIATLEGAGRTDFFLVQQPLPLNGRRKLLRQAGESAVREHQARAEQGLRQVEAELRGAFYRLLYAQERREAVLRSVAELDELSGLLRKREEEGEGSRLDVIRAEREVAEQETEAAEAEALIAEARAQLAAFLGGDAKRDELVAAGTLDPAYPLPARAEALAQGLASRGDYRSESERLERLRLESEAAGRLRIPDPVVAGGLKRADAGNRRLHGPVLSVSVSLPVFRKGQAERALAEAEADRTRARRLVMESRLLAEMRAAHDALRYRRKIASDYRDEAGSRAEALFAITEVAYREGELDLLDLLDSYRILQSTRLRILELRAAAKLAEIEFDLTVAREPAL